MPTSVAASKQAPPAAAAAAAGSPRGDNTLTDADAASALPHSHRPPDDALALAPLADRYTSALFTYPADDPTPRMKAGYAAQRSAKQKLDVARSQREGLEASLAEKLGRLHNLLRESREREVHATRMLRKKTVEVYEAELEEPPSNSDFKAKLVQLTSYVKKHRSPPALAELEAAGNADPQTKELARFVVQTVNSGVPHHLAALANLGVPIPTSEEDAWHRSLRQFQRHAREYWDNPLLVKATDGDVVKSIREFTYGSDERGAALKAWCTEQQEAFEEGSLTAGSERFDKLADAGFTFDVMVDDKEWEECVKWAKEFHGKYGHVHIPEGYVPPSLLPEEAASAPNLKEFAARIRAVVHRDALAPARASHLKTSGLYLDLGGRAYDYHVQYCKVGRGGRGEEQRTKRKFAVLEDIGEDGEIGNSRKVRRNNMNNWIEKLEKLAAHIETNGTVHVQNDVKQNLWTYSLIRKLSINSASLRGRKMQLLESHEGLKGVLLRKENVAAAVAEAKERKEGYETKKGKRSAVEMDEELAEEVLLGRREDEEVAAFMESGLEVPAAV